MVPESPGTDDDSGVPYGTVGLEVEGLPDPPKYPRKYGARTSQGASPFATPLAGCSLLGVVGAEVAGTVGKELRR